MEKVAMTLILVTMCLAFNLNHINGKEVSDFNTWAKMVHTQAEKVTQLHFYFQDTRSGNNPTVIQVAQANTSATSPTGFGRVFMMDDPLTLGPDPNSTLLGRSQGMYAYSGQHETTVFMVTSFVFKEGEYNGSTLSVLGHNPILEQIREVPIVGGTGYFRLARGVASLKTIYRNVTTRDAIVEYNVVVLHY